VLDNGKRLGQGVHRCPEAKGDTVVTPNNKLATLNSKLATLSINLLEGLSKDFRNDFIYQGHQMNQILLIKFALVLGRITVPSLNPFW
jgi:hypothetical protein